MMMTPAKFVIGALTVALGVKAADAVPEIHQRFASGTIVLENAERAPTPALESESEEKGEDSPAEAEEVAAQVCEPTPEELLLVIGQERELVAEDRARADDMLSEAELAREKLAIETAQLEELKAEIGGMLDKVKAAHTSDLDRLITFYTQMKPTEAATIMNDLDIEVTVMVLGAMAERSAAPIIAKMSPVRARAISKILFERSKLPGDQKLTGIRLQ
jgi:flagellar motility protein MotE (MotC chaperone)